MDRTCAKCGGDVEEGVLADTTYHKTFLTERQAVPSQWIRGDPSTLPRPGLMTRPLGMRPFLPDKCRTLPVTAARCGSCGLVELYAK